MANLSRLDFIRTQAAQMKSTTNAKGGRRKRWWGRAWHRTPSSKVKVEFAARFKASASAPDVAQPWADPLHVLWLAPM